MVSTRVMHLLSTGGFSGAENVACQIIEMFRACHGIDMVYCSPDGAVRETLRERAVPYYPIGRLSYRAVSQAVRDYKPSIIHAHDIRASVIAALFANRRIRVVSHVHCNHDDMNYLSTKAILFCLCARRFQRIIWVSDSALNNYRLKRMLPERSLVLRNIVSREPLLDRVSLDSGSYSYDCVYIGRITYQKNPQRLLRVFKTVLEKAPSSRMAIVGDGDLRQEAERLAIDLGIQDNVDFLGFLRNPYKILQSSKVMVMTSRYEGIPISALEAMALGVPIVSTPTDGLLDVVEDGVTGFLSDDDAILTERIVEIISDEGRRATMSAAASSRVDKINDLSEYRARLSDVYRLCEAG